MTPAEATEPQSAEGRILITGGTGFIGAWLTERLVGTGNEVVLLDTGNVEESTAGALGLPGRSGVTVVSGDVREPATFNRLGTDFTHIVHAAGILGIRKVVEQPVSTLDVNIRGGQTCLEFATRQRALQRIIMFSTSEIYGAHALGVDEQQPAEVGTDSLRWGYAASKVASEFFAMAYRAEYGLPTVTVRPFNVYGPHRRGYNAMTTLVSRALRGETLQLSGDGRQRRCWCFVTDLIDGLMGCLYRPSAVGNVFNIGNDETELTMLELARLIVELTGSPSAIELMGDQVPDVRARRPDVTKARRLLGYSPGVDVATGILRTAYAGRSELKAA
jgi:nucleoside-diphosphate-sugar epimerase